MKQALAVQAVEPQVSRAKTADAATQAGSVLTAQPDAANLSSASNLVMQAIAGSDVRTDKVEALQKAIANGSYNVPSSAIADKIIQSMTE
jgi:negative regulator of flagellin synthesis FlgM